MCMSAYHILSLGNAIGQIQGKALHLQRLFYCMFNSRARHPPKLTGWWAEEIRLVPR